MKQICFVLSLSCMLFIFISATPQTSSEYLTHTVVKGESISLICIDYYGRYSPAMGLALQKLNPSLKDINVIVAGQQLTFKSPRSPALAQPSNPTTAVSADTVFSQNVAAIQGVVTCVVGNVALRKAGQKLTEKLVVNSIVYPGDNIRTAANGRAELIINREAVVRLKENTVLTIQAFRDDSRQQTKTTINTAIGSLWTKMRKFSDKISRFEIETPTAVAGVHGTVYQTTVSKDSSAEVKVYTGEVSVANNPSFAGGSNATDLTEVSGPQEVEGPQEVSMEEWTQIIRDMQRIKIGKNGKPQAVESFTKNSKDSWEQWNEERDKRIAQLFTEQK